MKKFIYFSDTCFGATAEGRPAKYPH